MSVEVAIKMRAMLDRNNMQAGFFLHALTVRSVQAEVTSLV